jgi:enoyl-CoA hydratase/carnithine racemase
MIAASDALYAGLADVFVPAAELPALQALVIASSAGSLREAISRFAAPFASQADPASSRLASMRESIEHHFSGDSITELMASLSADSSEFAGKTLETMRKRSPLMMCVTLSQLRRAATMTIGDCLRMERTMVRRCFEHGEVIEGVRALAIDKDHAPKWNPATLAEVTPSMVEGFFESAWPAYAHPLRSLG